MTITPKPIYVAGVDCGGTNTDCAVLLQDPSPRVVASSKTPTTADPKDGILTVLQEACKLAGLQPKDLSSIVIGTTHFLNAVLSVDSNRLKPVGILRLGSPYTAECPPFCDFPDKLRKVVEGPWAICKGGLQISGLPIGDVDEEEIRVQCRRFKDLGIQAVAIVGVYSPLDKPGFSQEERVASIIAEDMPGAIAVCSREVGQVGFLEREGATVLNASISHFAKVTVASFKAAIKAIGSDAQLFLTRNDGTLCSAEEAARLPVRTFSSGSTNSLRGAALLAELDSDEDILNSSGNGQIIVCDIGGTSSDVGVLLKSGFPRPAAAFVEIAGLRTNFSMPDIQSIGLGGGSIIRRDGDKVTVGPDSVGYRLLTEGLTFGGSIATATDVAVAAGADIGSKTEAARAYFDASTLEAAKLDIKRRLEAIFKRMRTSPEPATLILVGGGSVIAPDEFEGIGRVIKPRLAGCANAIGAACARVSATIDTIVSVPPGGWQRTFEEIKAKVIEETIAAGAKPETVELVEADNLPIQYVTTGATRVIFKAVGEPDLAAMSALAAKRASIIPSEDLIDTLPPPVTLKKGEEVPTPVDIDAYRPKVINGEWFLSELDLEWIAEGSGVLGVGGGGSTYYPAIMAREILRKGGNIRVKRITDIPDDKYIFRGGFMGSPSVSAERLQAGTELETAIGALCRHMDLTMCRSIDREKWDVAAMIAEEIGGGNGIQPLIAGSSAHLDVPIVDADLQGRAYPCLYQCLPIAYSIRGAAAPAAVADAVGNIIVIPSSSTKWHVEIMLRAACTTLGSKAFETMGPLKAKVLKQYSVHNTLSQCWLIGRALARCRQSSQVSSIPRSIFELQSGKTLFIGKVVSIEREVRSAFTWGKMTLEPLSETERDAEETSEAFSGSLEVEFQNEWLVARHSTTTGQAKAKLLAIVPDLITCLDAQSGTALGTHEVRFGLLLTVIALKGDPLWYTEQGLDCGGPIRFDIEENEYYDAGLGEYKKPQSVIDMYDQKE